MPQVYFSTSLAPGQTSRTFNLSDANPDGAKTYLVTYNRDHGLLLADGSPDINQEAVLTIRQLAADGTTQVTLRSDRAFGATGFWQFIPDPSGGVLSIVNSGPGTVQNVTVSEYVYDER